MASLTGAKLEQATRLVAQSDVDVWMVFDRESVEGGDPVLPLILDGGLTWQSALLVSREGRRVAIVGNYDADAIRASGNWHQVIGYVESIREPLVDTLEALTGASSRPPRIAVDYSTDDVKADGLSHGMYLLLVDYLRGSRCEDCLVSAQEIVGALRSRKIPEEIARMRAAIAATDRLFAEVSEFAGVGTSEREIYHHVQGRIAQRGLGYAWDPAGDPIVNSGPDSMVGHGLPSADIRVAPGHILHLDLGVVVDDYSSDIQRCWYVPAPGENELPPDVRRALAAVNGAITAGARALRPGTPGWQVDEAARRTIVEQGFDEYMHALGHQVGRKAHDGGGLLGPRWQRYGRTPFMPVEVDQVYTLELGVMVEGRGYLGIEEMVQVTESGCEWLSERQLEIPLLAT